jgi:uncharacterized membrane protein
MIVCGILEYITGWYLFNFKGARWWDYTGYFLNINGYICLEGLLVFALGGTLSIYLLAPILDEKFNKLNPKILNIICTILILIFAVDFAYSFKHPRIGKGITE